MIQGRKDFSEKIERERISDEISDELEIREEKTKLPPGFTSVKEVTKWAQRKKLFDRCICGHEKVYHFDDRLKGEGKNFEECIKGCKIIDCKCCTYTIVPSVF